MHPVQGVELAAVSAGLKKDAALDLVLMSCAEGSTCSAVFTQNAFCAAPVHVAKEHLADAAPRFLLINSGNANAGTGVQGLHNATQTCRQLAEGAGLSAKSVLPFSTGVINQQLDMEAMGNGIDALADQMGLGELTGRQLRQLSGGQQRKVEIARALLNQPDLLIMDEPSAGLDVTSRRALVSDIRELSRSGGTAVLWATHLVDELVDADDIILLNKGKVVATGGPAALAELAQAPDLADAYDRLVGGSQMPD